jgi:hypothetical protein
MVRRISDVFLAIASKATVLAGVDIPWSFEFVAARPDFA